MKEKANLMIQIEGDEKWYTLGELIEKGKPQHERDKAVISDCIRGLGLHAAVHAHIDEFSPRISEIRGFIEVMASYWGFEDNDNLVTLDDFLKAFDEQIEAAKSGATVSENEILNTQGNTIYGLYRYGEDMVVSLGSDGVEHIQSAIDLMKDIAEAWDFESDLLDSLTATLENEVREMRDGISASEQQPDNEASQGQAGDMKMGY